MNQAKIGKGSVGRIAERIVNAMGFPQGLKPAFIFWHFRHD
jgi:hypothetical protein